MMKSSGYLAENAPQLAAERMQEAMHELADKHGTEVQMAEVPDEGESKGKDSAAGSGKHISQETFDEVVKENMEDFEMDEAEAVADAMAQFKQQGVDLSNIVCRGATAAEACPITEAVKAVALVLGGADGAGESAAPALARIAALPAGEFVGHMAVIEAECKPSEEKKLVARKAGAMDTVLDSVRVLASASASVSAASVSAASAPAMAEALAASLGALASLFCKDAINRLSVREDFVDLTAGLAAAPKAATRPALVRSKALALVRATCVRNEPNKGRFWVAGVRNIVVDNIDWCVGAFAAAGEEPAAAAADGAAAAGGMLAAAAASVGDAGAAGAEDAAHQEAADSAAVLGLLRNCCMLLGVLFSDDDRRDGISPETFKRAREAGDGGILDTLFAAFKAAPVVASAQCVADLCWALKVR